MLLGSLSALKELHINASISEDAVEMSAPLAHMTALEQLNITNPPLLPKLLAVVAMPALKSLSVTLVCVDHELALYDYLQTGLQYEPGTMEGHELDCISCLTTLENMVFRNVELADDSKLSLSALPRVVSLKLINTRIPPGGALLRGAASLQELELDLNCIRLDDAVLAAVDALPQLRKLSVSYERGRSNLESFERLLYLGQLQKKLQARGCHLVTHQLIL